MAKPKSLTRFKNLQRVFGQGRSEILNSLARMSVLYEDLRIESLAITADDNELRRLDYLDMPYRVHYFLRRSMVTLLEFRGALLCVSQSQEYVGKRNCVCCSDAALGKNNNRDLFSVLDDALGFFESNHKLLKKLRNAVGGHFSSAAAESATKNIDSDATGKLEITFDPDGSGGGTKLYYAGELAATAFTQRLPGGKDQNADAIRMVRDGYSHAARSMHALIILFLWERFG